MTGARDLAMKWLDAVSRLYEKLRPAILILILLLLVAGSVTVFLWATGPHGIGVRSDSVAYLWSSENLVKGIGLGRLNGLGEFRPMTHWPPLYPFLLALPQWFGLNSLSAARLLGAVTIGLMVILFGVSISRLTQGSPWYTGLGTLILVTSYAMWDASLYAMTEPLYMVLGLLAFLFLDNYLSSNKRVWLYASSVILGLGLLTRYAGGALILVALLALLIQPGQVFRQKIRDSVILLLISVLPLALWTIRNILLADTATNRYLEFASIPAEEWLNLKNLAAGWLLPVLKISEVNSPRLLIIVLAAIVLAWFTGRSKRLEQEKPSRLWVIFLLYAFSYAGYILFSKLLFDKTIPLGEERIFLPFYATVLMLVVYGLFLLEKRLSNRPYLRIALICIYVLVATGFVRGYIEETASYANLSNEKGLGLANESVTGLEIIPVIKELPSGPVIFTDDLEILYFLTGRHSFQINEVTPEEILKIKEFMEQRGVYVVLFGEHELGEQLKTRIPELEKIYSGDDVIYSGGNLP
jgi:4-amino-4-deoxy-L-arabinose transferase-like glycosyltransferase